MFESQRKITIENPDLLGHDKKFDTAIRQSTINAFKKRTINGENTFDDQLLLKSNHYELDAEDIVADNTLYSRILDRVLNYPTKFPLTTVGKESKNDHYSNPVFIMNLIQQSTMIQIRYMNNQNYLPNKNEILKKARAFLGVEDCPREILNLTYAVTEASNIVELTKAVFNYRFHSNLSEEKIEELQHRALGKNHFTWSAIGIKFVWSRNLLYTHDMRTGSKSILPRPYILLIHNKLADLLSVLVLVYYGQKSIYQPDAYEIVIRFVKEMIYLCRIYKNKFYTIIKGLEGFVAGEHMSANDSWRNIGFLLSTSDDLYESTGFDYMSSTLRDIILTGNTVLRNELSCLSKILGHPLVSMEGGARSLYEKVNNETDIDPQAVQEVLNCAKRDYVNSFIARHGKWPNVHFNGHPGDILFNAWKLNCPLFSPKLPNHLQRLPSLEDYVHLELGKDMRFNFMDNFIPYLKDKTISLLKSDVLKKYFSSDEHLDTSDWKNTRLLLYYLMNPEDVTDHVDYIKRYMDSPDLEDLMNYLVIKVVPKEKEMKEKFRGFGCKSYLERSRALVQEKNVMRYLDLYSSEQVMTTTELELENKLYAFRNLGKAYTDHTVLYISIDASSWNNRFRKETVDEIHKDFLDRIFGTRIFGKTQLSFEKSLIYIPDEEGTYGWQGQRGGIEGLNQDTWVAVYIPMIHAALKDCQYKYYVLCKGDDLRVAIIIPPKVLLGTTIKKIQRDILSQISKFLERVGHTVKIDECYGSSSLFTFSKNPSINGICLPQGFRKIQKSHGANNALLCTLDDYASSSLSNAHSAAKVLSSPFAAYGVGLFWFFHYLLCSPEYSTMSEDQLVAASLIPSTVGGFPLIYLHNFYVRAEADLLPSFLDLYTYLKTVNRSIADIMANFMEVQQEVPTDISGLCSDIYSLPTYMPLLPTTKLRMLMTPVLPRITKHEVLKELLMLAKSEEVIECKRVLSSARFLIMKPIQVISESFPDDIIKTLLRKFESARSIIDVIYKGMPRHQATKALRSVMFQEIKLQKWRSSRLRGNHSILGRNYQRLVSGVCPMKDADVIRHFAWGKPVIGVTMPPVCHTMEYGTRAQMMSSEHYVSHHFTYFLDDNSSLTYLKDDKQRARGWAIGTQKPFLGYKTSAGTLAPSVHFIEKDNILTNLKNLIELSYWYDKEVILPDGTTVHSNIRSLIESVVRLYTAKNMVDLSPFSGQRKSGTPEHHLPSSSFMRSIVPNCLPNIYSQVKRVSNSHIVYRSSNKLKMNMLQLMCHSVSIITQEIGFSRRITTPLEVWGATKLCDTCMTPIKEELLVFDQKKIDKLKIPPLRSMKIGEASLEILLQSLVEFQSREKFTYVDPQPGDTDICSAAIVQIYLDQHYKESVQFSTQSERGLMNVGSHRLVRALQIANVSKTIGKTELKKASLVHMIYALCSYVYSYLIHGKRPYLKNVPLDKLTPPLVHHAKTLPWYKLMQDLVEIGRLQEFIDKLSNLSGFPTDYSTANLDVTVAVLTHQCLAIHMMEMPSLWPLPIVYISDLALIGRKGLLTQYLGTLKWNVLRSEALNELEPVYRKTRALKFEDYFALYHIVTNQQDYADYMHDYEPAVDPILDIFYPITKLILAVTICCSEIHNLSDIVLEDIVTPSGEFLLSAICDTTLPDLDELDLDEIKQRAGPLLLEVYRMTDTNDDIIQSLLRMEDSNIWANNLYREAFENLQNKLNTTVINVRLLSKVQAIETVRSMPDSRTQFTPAHQISFLDNDYRFQLTRSETPTNDSSKVLRLKDVFVSTDVDNFAIVPAVRSEYITPSYAQVCRPLGVMTGTYSILVDLYHTLGLRTGIAHMTIVALGCGAGNDLIFLSQVYPKSSFWIMTKPPKGQTSYDCTIVKAFVPEENLGDYHADHIRQGIFDASDPVSWIYMRKTMATVNRESITNLIWCDIDYTDTDSPYEKFLENMLTHYAYHTHNTCMLISKIDITSPVSFRFLYQLKKLSIHLYLTRPSPMINCRYVYAVAIGRSSLHNPDMYGSILNHHIPVSSNIYTIVSKWVTTHVHNPIINRHKVKSYNMANDNYLKLPKYPLALQSLAICKPMFESLLRHRLSIPISYDMIEKLLHPKTTLIPIPTHYHYDNLVIDYEGLIRQYRRDLGGYDRQQLFFLDTQHSRVIIIRKYMRLMGFKLIHDLGKQNTPFDLNFTTVKAAFWEHYIRLHPRDRDYNIVHTNDIFKFDYQECGIFPEYFTHFTKGVNIGLTLVAFVRYHYPNFVKNDFAGIIPATHLYIGDETTHYHVSHNVIHAERQRILEDSFSSNEDNDGLF